MQACCWNWSESGGISVGRQMKREVVVMKKDNENEKKRSHCGKRTQMNDDRYLVDPASGICLSQRLSHASLSISYSYGETANGSVKQQ